SFSCLVCIAIASALPLAEQRVHKRRCMFMDGRCDFLAHRPHIVSLRHVQKLPPGRARALQCGSVMATHSVRSDEGSQGPLGSYLSRIDRYRLLTPDEERELAARWRTERDQEAAGRLVTANLRFVVKIAFEYRTYGLRLLDLIQEG